MATRHAELGYGLATVDEPPRPGTTIDDLAGLKTPFRAHGNVTAGNAAGLNDGATACLLASQQAAAELGLPVKMRLVAFAFVGVEPEVMGVGPVPATEKALAKAGLTIEDIGLFELNEAFAVQVLAFLDHFGIADDDPRVNEYGGAIAVGHPLASSGVRLMTSSPASSRSTPRSATASPPCASASAWAQPSSGRTRTTLTTAGDRGDRGTEQHQPDREGRRAAARGTERLPDRGRDPHARPRHRPPGGAGTLALITLDNGHDHTKPNTFGPQSIAGLHHDDRPACAERAAAGEIAAVGVTGKPFIFAVGADLTGVAHAPPRPGARAWPEPATRAFGAIIDLPVPTFAFVNGAAMGGGVELALACDYRTICAGVPAVALPEVFLGLVPGWGGC